MQQFDGGKVWKRIILLFFLGWVLMYANRTILAPMLRVLEIEWGLSKTFLGLLNSAFFLTYTFMQVPSGILADKFGRKMILVPGFIIHGLGAFLSGLTGKPSTLLTMRIFTGLGQGTYYSSQYAIASASIPGSQRALGMSIINSGMSFGIALGWLLGGQMLYRMDLSWRSPFILLGGITIGLAIIMQVVLKNDAGDGLNKVKRDVQSSIRESHSSWKVFAQRNLLLSYIVTFCSMYGFFTIITWLPYYLQMQRGIPGEQAGLISTLIPLAAVPSGIMFGKVSDMMRNRKKILSILFPLATLGIFLIGFEFLGNIALILGLVLYGFSGKLVGEPLLVALVGESTPIEIHATAYGLLNFSGTISTVLAPLITGIMADMTGEFSSAFLLAIMLQVMAFLAVLLIKEQKAFR